MQRYWIAIHFSPNFLEPKYYGPYDCETQAVEVCAELENRSPANFADDDATALAHPDRYDRTEVQELRTL